MHALAVGKRLQRAVHRRYAVAARLLRADFLRGLAEVGEEGLRGLLVGGRDNEMKVGRLLKTLEPAAPWYRPYARVRSPAPNRPPVSTIYGSWEDENGYLWVIGDVASPNWKRFLAKEPKRVEGALVYETLDRQRMYDTVIDIFDPKANRLVASQRFPSRTFEYVIGDNLIGGIRETDEGVPYVAVWKVRLVHP